MKILWKIDKIAIQNILLIFQVTVLNSGTIVIIILNGIFTHFQQHNNKCSISVYPIHFVPTLCDFVWNRLIFLSCLDLGAEGLDVVFLSGFLYTPCWPMYKCLGYVVIHIPLVLVEAVMAEDDLDWVVCGD